MSLSPLCLSPIGVIYTPYKEKFSVPRQANLVQDGTGILELLPPYNQAEAVRGLDAFSHLWLIFQFDRVPLGKWRPTVRPPRLGGNQRLGVFASRATHRPNPLGLSKVALRRVECAGGKVRLHLGAVDLVDGTPILDIKPYLAYADSEPLAQSGFAQEKPEMTLKVEFSPQAMRQIAEIEKIQPHFCRFVSEVIAQDPRPAYQKNQNNIRSYGLRLYDYNIRWQMKENKPQVAWVLEIEKWQEI